MPSSEPQYAASPEVPARPRTANLRMALSLESIHPTGRAPSEPSPVASGRGAAGEGSVLWSQEDVAQEDLARPHTSNPRYSEMFGVETPRVTPSSARLETPSRTSNDTTSAVLWASEARDIKPSMLARPTTSNPWLHRFLDHVPEPVPAAKLPPGVSAERQRSLILWSEKAIEDWRLLARPHASNPAYEASASASAANREGSNPQAGSSQRSEVLWSSDDVTAGTQPATEPTVAQLQEVIVAQAARIAQLEREANDLRLRLNVVGELATCMPGGAHRSPLAESPPHPSPGGPGMSPSAAHGGNHAATSGWMPERPATRTARTRHNAEPPARTATAEPPSTPPLGYPYAGDGAATVNSLPPANAGTPAEAFQTPPRPTTAEPKHVTIEAAPTDIIADDDSGGDDAAEELFRRESERQAKAGGASSSFADRLRAKTTTRPDTAAPVRTADPPPAAARPGSAPVSRRVPRDAMPATYAAMRSDAVTSDASITEAYRSLCLPGRDTVSKASFRQMYKARGAEFGIVASEKALDRMLRPYNAAGRDSLSYDEFAVLYLQLQRW